MAGEKTIIQTRTYTIADRGKAIVEREDHGCNVRLFNIDGVEVGAASFPRRRVDSMTKMEMARLIQQNCQSATT